MENPPRETARLIVFAKLPLPGQVKTRLARAVGEEKAAALYKAWVPPFIETLLMLEDGASIEVCVAAPPQEDSDPIDPILTAGAWLPFPVEFALQEGADLGERLTRAFDRSFASGWSQVLVLGSDSPQLTSAEVRTNLDLLQEYDMVLGPTEDGGFYAVGFATPPGDLLEEIRWSTPEAFSDAQTAARSRGLSISEGPLGYDLDRVEDSIRLVQSDPKRWSNLREILGVEFFS